MFTGSIRSSSVSDLVPTPQSVEHWSHGPTSQLGLVSGVRASRRVPPQAELLVGDGGYTPVPGQGRLSHDWGRAGTGERGCSSGCCSSGYTKAVKHGNCSVDIEIPVFFSSNFRLPQPIFWELCKTLPLQSTKTGLREQTPTAITWVVGMVGGSRHAPACTTIV